MSQYAAIVDACALDSLARVLSAQRRLCRVLAVSKRPFSGLLACSGRRRFLIPFLCPDHPAPRSAILSRPIRPVEYNLTGDRDVKNPNSSLAHVLHADPGALGPKLQAYVHSINFEKHPFACGRPVLTRAAGFSFPIASFVVR